MKTIYRDIKFEKERPGLWFCRNKSQNIIIGWVDFYSPWKQYCFYPTDGPIILNKTCLLDIVDFIDQLKEVK